MMPRGRVSAWLVALALSQGVAGGANWPQFRGPDGTGVADDPRLPEVWSTNQNVAWSAVIPGAGWSSPVVWGNKVFVTAVVSDGATEPPRKGLYFGGERLTVSTNLHHWVVFCLDWDTGNTVWRTEVHRGLPTGPHHLKNTYASETPVTDGEHLYAYFGNVGLFCLDLDGHEVWSQQWGAYRTRNGWGTAASPALDRDRVYVVDDNEEQSFLVSLDKRTGKQLWRVAREEKSNWSTPYLWRNDRRPELVTAGRNQVRSYDRDGKLLWEFGGMSSIVIPTPFASGGLLYVASGYVGDKVRPVFAVRPGASGNVSLKEDESTNEFILWHQPAGGPYNPSPIVYGGDFYVLYDFGFLACSDARTGREIYGKQRLNTQGTSGFTASPWAYHGRIFCLSEDGDTFVVEAGPTYRLLGKNSLGEMCLATPAIAGDSLIIRTASRLYRIRDATR